MRVVVTGALGHIGSRLIRELAAAFPGAEVVMLDNLATERYASLYDLPAACHYEFIEGDILSADLASVFAGADAVVHLAALTNGARADWHEQMERVNVAGTERVARACAGLGVGLLFPSTTSVYGVPHGIVTEDCAPQDLKPQSPYAGWKLQSEDRLRSLGRQEGLKFVIFRMGTIFGPSPGMRFHTAVNQFCWRAMANQPLEIWRTAMHQYRPYLDVSDAAGAMVFVLRHRQFHGGVYNVLTVNATVQQVVDTLAGFVPAIRLDYVDSPLMNRLSYHVDQGRFRQLGFDFTGSLARGIGDTVALLATAQSARADIPRYLPVTMPYGWAGNNVEGPPVWLDASFASWLDRHPDLDDVRRYLPASPGSTVFAGQEDLNALRSSYVTRGYGSLFYALVRVLEPTCAVEIGILEGFSLLSAAAALRDNGAGRITGYDLFDDYPHHHADRDQVSCRIAAAGLDAWVSIEAGDVANVAGRWPEVDYLHVDVSNTGDTYRQVFEQWSDRVRQVILLEGGSVDRDRVQWMRRYAKPGIVPAIAELTRTHPGWSFTVLEPFPSLTVAINTRAIPAAR